MRRRTAAAFLAPFCLLFLLFFAAPIAYAIGQSLTRVERSGLLGLHGRHTTFAGASNYARALSDTDFVTSVGRILLFAVVMVPLMVVASVALAMLLESGLARWPRFFRTTYFLPYGVPGVIASIMWGFLYAPGTSPLTPLFTRAGVDVDLLGPGTVFWSLMNIVLWEFAGYNMLIVVAQLKSIPGSLYEAAMVDGASRWKIMHRIQLPLVRPAIVLITVFTTIGTLQLFNEPIVLWQVASGITDTYTPATTSYHEAFDNNDLGAAAAQSVLLALVTAVLSFGLLRLATRRRPVDGAIRREGAR